MIGRPTSTSDLSPAEKNMSKTLISKSQKNEHGNYLRKFDRLVAAGMIPAGSRVIDVEHDSWCAIFRGRHCNCDPDIVVRAWIGPEIAQ